MVRDAHKNAVGLVARKMQEFGRAMDQVRNFRFDSVQNGLIAQVGTDLNNEHGRLAVQHWTAAGHKFQEMQHHILAAIEELETYDQGL